MPTYTTPGVHVEETPSFPPPVVEAGTAIPALMAMVQPAEFIVIRFACEW